MPKAIGDFLILDALRASGGTAVAVSDEELIAAVREIGSVEGIFCAPEGAACLPALKKLLASEGHRVVQKGKRFFVADYEKAVINSFA